MGFRENRVQSTCASCGHPRMAHLGQPCYCGCARFTTVPDPVVPEPDAPVNKLLEFMHEYMSKDERDRLVSLIAAHKGVAPPEPRTHPATRSFIVENLTRTETLRYLDELRRRRMAGDPLVRY